MNRKPVLIIAAACLSLIGISGASFYFGERHSAKADEASACVAGAGEICPSADFVLELKNLKRLGDKQKALSQDPKVKELIEIMDTQRGMAERMQGEINQTLQANPGHQWDGVKEKFLPAQLPAPVPVTPAQAPPK